MVRLAVGLVAVAVLAAAVWLIVGHQRRMRAKRTKWEVAVTAGGCFTDVQVELRQPRAIGRKPVVLKKVYVGTVPNMADDWQQQVFDHEQNAFALATALNAKLAR